MSDPRSLQRVVYLHGFASSPRSSKAQFFARELRALGVQVDIPQLDGGHFEQLTITSQLAIVDQAVGPGPVTLFGSSLGGYLAALYAARHPQSVERLVLLAPAFQFPSRWRQRYTEEQLEKWRREGSAPVFHYGENRIIPLGYALMEDSILYEEEPDARQPILIFHGSRDEIVPVEVSRQFCATHPHARLEVFNSGHELTDVLEPMWQRALPFLNNGP